MSHFLGKIFQERNLLTLASFIAGFSLMTIELVASRIMSPIIGSSVFTWTSVIGVILLGMAVGSLLGGKLADKYSDNSILSLAFVISSVAVFIIPFLSSHFSWIIENTNSIIVATLFLSIYIFLIPSIFMGSIQPIILKKYSQNFSKIGSEYGFLSSIWSLGSILGVFLTGFLFISFLGSMETIYSIAVVLILLGLIFSIVYKEKKVTIYLFIILIFFLVALFFQMIQISKTKNIVYEKETQYYKARIVDFQTLAFGKSRALFLDFDSHSIETSKIVPNFYTEIYPAFKAFNDNIRDILVIGAGAYTLPKYLSNFYEKSEVSVIEIDPEISMIAKKYFNLDTVKIKTIVGDARQVVGKSDKKYDLIYGDAYSSFISVPGHLLTLEWNEEIKKHLNENGIYAINFIGSLSGEKSALFRSILNTFRKTFDNYYIFSFGNSQDSIQNITILGLNSRERMDKVEISKLLARGQNSFLSGYLVSNDEKYLDPNVLILTDNFYPIEKLMFPVIKDYFPQYLSFEKNLVR